MPSPANAVPVNAPIRLQWNITGHQVVAQMAEEILTNEKPAVFQAIETIIAADTRERGEDLLSFAAWPDRVKKQNGTSNWHFVDIPFTPGDANPGALPPAPNVLSALTQQTEVLRTSADPTARADALAYIAHFVGDIHQPLHCVTLVWPPQFPTGDRGGNDFKINIPVPNDKDKNLHFLWDGLVGSSDAEVVPAAQQLLQDFPRTAFTQELAEVNFEQWARASNAIARQAYERLLPVPPATGPSADYLDWASGVAQRQVALAAWRLADHLTRLLT